MIAVVNLWQPVTCCQILQPLCFGWNVGAVPRVLR